MGAGVVNSFWKCWSWSYPRQQGDIAEENRPIPACSNAHYPGQQERAGRGEPEFEGSSADLGGTNCIHKKILTKQYAIL